MKVKSDVTGLFIGEKKELDGMVEVRWIDAERGACREVLEREAVTMDKTTFKRVFDAAEGSGGACSVCGVSRQDWLRNIGKFERCRWFSFRVGAFCGECIGELARE